MDGGTLPERAEGEREKSLIEKISYETLIKFKGKYSKLINEK